MATAAAAPTAEQLDHIQKVVSGFRINSMNMRDASNGKLLWEQSDWRNTFTEELPITLPASILDCKVVSREMHFTSKESINKFRLRQLVTLFDQPIEEWKFEFGFVIPNSTNTWQCTIEAGAPKDMIPAEVLNGNVVIETSFYDADLFICKSKIRVFYE